MNSKLPSDPGRRSGTGQFPSPPSLHGQNPPTPRSYHPTTDATGGPLWNRNTGCRTVVSVSGSHNGVPPDRIDKRSHVRSVETLPFDEHTRARHLRRGEGRHEGGHTLHEDTPALDTSGTHWAPRTPSPSRPDPETGPRSRTLTGRSPRIWAQRNRRTTPIGQT